MNLFCFKLLLEQEENFFRDIEIRADQNFAELRNIIHQQIQLDGNELASFYICDKDWNRDIEITQLDMTDEAEGADSITMDNSNIGDYFHSKEQTIVYEYDFLNPITFYLKCIGIKEADPNAEYPQCIAASEDTEEIVLRDNANSEQDEISSLLADFDDMLGDTQIPGEELTDDFDAYEG